jgi:hypothetical protein
MQVYDTCQFSIVFISMIVKRHTVRFHTDVCVERRIYSSFRKIAIFFKTSASVTPSRESSKPGVSTNVIVDLFL